MPSGTFYLFASTDGPQAELQCIFIQKESFSKSSCFLLCIYDIPTIAAICNVQQNSQCHPEDIND